MSRWILAALLLLGTGLASPAGAHPLAPSLLDLRETAPGRITALWRRPQLLRVGVRLEPVLPGRCRTVEPPVETEEGAALVTRWTADCGPAGLSGGTVAVRGLAEAGSDALLRIELADGRRVQAVLRPAAPSFVLPPEQGATGVATGYLALGIGHLLTGWDHLAFVLGLVLLVGGWSRLLGTVTAFTLGHSLTLSLSALGLVRLPTGPIEAAIALSILALAVELARRDRPTLFGRRPWLMAAGFGLPADSFSYSLDRIQKTVIKGSVGGYMRSNAQGNQTTRVDLEGLFEDVTGDEKRNNRFIATLTFSQKMTGDMSAAFSVVYANKPEYLGEVDEELGARVGLRYKIDQGD